RHDLDVFMSGASVPLVLDPEVRKVDASVEVRQVMLARPLLDLTLVAIGLAVAVGAAAGVLLQPFLVLALQFLLNDDPASFGALLAKPFLLAQVGAIKPHVVRQVSRPTDAGEEVLPAFVGAIAAVCFQEVVAAVGLRRGAFAAVERYEPDKAFVLEMSEV